MSNNSSGVIPSMMNTEQETTSRALPPLTISDDGTNSTRRRNSIVETILEELKIGSSQGNDRMSKRKLSRQLSSGERKISDSKVEKKHARRDSIKEHLLKFKMKAGKVLEEVHERLVDDHAGNPISPLTPTYSSTTVLDFQEEEVSGNEERVLSPTFSQSSKKTVSSDELKASLRSKIRKQAEKVVERKRDSVQLTRRLKRRLTTHMEDMPTEHDIENVDSQIETSIKLGSRFDRSENISVFPSKTEQYLFCTAEYKRETERISSSQMINYVKPEPFAESVSCVTDVSLYSSSLQAEQQMVNRHISSPFSTIEDSSVKVGTDTNFRWEIGEYENLMYIPAENKEHLDFVDVTSYSEIKIQLENLIIFFSEDETDEDKLASNLYMAHGNMISSITKMNVLGELIEKINETKNSVPTTDPSQDRMTESLVESFNNQENQFKNSVSAVFDIWKTLQLQREKQGYALTSISVKEGKDEKDDLSEKFPTVPRLSQNHPITAFKKLPPEIRTRLEARKRRKFNITMKFNNKVVGTTKSFKFSESLCCKIGHTFDMELFSEFSSLTGIIHEKKFLKNIEVARINFQKPTKDFVLTAQVSTFQSEPSEKEGTFLSGALVYYISQEDRPKSLSVNSELNGESVKTSETSVFQLIPPICRLVSDEEFESNVRWDVLERRFRMKLSLKSSDLHRIGLDSAEVDASILYGEDRESGPTGYKTCFDGHRVTANNRSVAMRRRVLESVVETSDNVQYDQIVREEPLGATISFANLFGPPDLSRKLKPMRKEYARQQSINVTTCHLIINIQSAINLPTRKNGSLQSFIECSFQNKKFVTKPAIGKHPNWQQTFRIPVDTANIDLRSITDNIEVNLYDQFVSQLDFDEREMNSIHEQLHRHLLGTVLLPFSTVYSRGKVDGGFRIKFPFLLSGYTSSAKESYMKLIVALDPPMMPPKMLPSTGFETSESNKIMNQCGAWEKSLRTQFEDRRYNATVLDIYGKRVLCSRYLRPVKPPPCIENLAQIHSINSKKTLEFIATIVSYIPFVSDPILFPGLIDMWASVDQFVSVGSGDEEEHAVLLCCWLLYLHFNSYVVLGSSLPEGNKAAYVLTNNNDTLYLLSPTDGNVYSLDDVMCPLISIGTVISPMNIYGNIQPFVHCSQMTFDFTKSVHWKPLFDRDMLQLDSVQPGSLAYTEVSEDSIMELRASIEREIKVTFDDARQFAIPQWNLMASRLLREILQEVSDSSSSILDEKLVRLRESYNITVCAIRIPYQSLQHCVRSVLSLDMHVNTNTSAQFALAVHIHPYFNNVISCSIALAVLTLKK